MKHTKLPWSVEGAGIKAEGETTELSSGREVRFRVATCKDGDVETVKANAEFIVKAVNCHDELLAALRPLAALDLRPDGFDKLSDDQPIYARDSTIITIGDVRRARAAIARAEGKTK